MSDGTKIEWTEATWNPITGCSVTSPGCTNCYAMKLAGTRLRDHPSRAGLTIDSKAGPVWTGEVRFNEQWLNQPLRWKRPRMIFVCAHGDLFHESVPDEWIDRVFAVMALAPQHTFQVLTKRSARMREYVGDVLDGKRGVLCAMDDLGAPSVTENADALWGSEDASNPRPLPNVWLGVSVEDQQRADERIPDLLATPAAVRWLSCEPLLGPVNLNRLDDPAYHSFYIDPLNGEAWDDVNGGLNQEVWGQDEGPKLDWIVAGGESSPGARPMHPDWARSLRDQCSAAGVPFFFKQWGEWAPKGWEHANSKLHLTLDGRVVEKKDCDANRDIPGRGLIEIEKLGKKRAGRLLDGLTHDGYPS